MSSVSQPPSCPAGLSAAILFRKLDTLVNKFTQSGMAVRWSFGPLVLLVSVLAGSLHGPSADQDAARPAQSLTAEGVARAMDARDRGRDSRGEMRMRLIDRQGRARERVLTIAALKGSGGMGDKTLVRFTYPNDIRGTSFLVWEHEDASDERFLYLPALGRVRRIAGQEKQESFVGSDLSYEDIGGRDIADYTYAFASENASWTAPDGSRHAAWALESRARDKDAEFPRSVAIVLKAQLVSVHADIFNRRDERAKVFDVKRLERVDGIWSALDLTVSNERDRTRTELTTTSLRYNVGLKDEDFSRRQLEAGAR
jgi:hypothetical protein